MMIFVRPGITQRIWNFQYSYTMIKAFDQREIIVIGFSEVDPEQFPSLCGIDVKERLANPLDDVIEPRIDRKFGILFSEDDFSAAGAVEYKPPTIHGEEPIYKRFQVIYQRSQIQSPKHPLTAIVPKMLEKIRALRTTDNA